MLSRVSLPKTNLDVSRLCLGTANLGLKQSESEAHSLLDHFVELGGNYLDTARIYSDWIPGEIGRSERIIGDWLRQNRGKRDKLVVGTKGAHYEWNDKSLNRVTQEDVRHDLELSLQALSTDFIDVYYLHRDSPVLSAERIVDFMQVFIDEGKVRHLAVANWTAARLSTANEYAEREGKHGFVVNQPQFSLGSWNINDGNDDVTLVHLDNSGYDYHSASGLSMAPYSPQAQGFFTKALGEKDFDQERFDKSRFNNRANLTVAKLVKAFAADKGCNANAIVLAYLLHQPFPITPIVGCYTKELLDDSFKALQVVLEKDELQALEDAVGSGVVH